MKIPDIYYTQITQLNKCFEKKFVLQALRVKLFPEKFSDKTDVDILRKAGFQENEEFLKDPQNIAQLVRALIEQKQITYIHEFEAVTN